LARTLLEGQLDLSLSALVGHALKIQPITAAHDQAADFSVFELSGFVYDRLRNYYADQGIPSSQFDAVQNIEHDSLPDFDRRLKAIGEFAKLPEAEALAAANKRIRNILRKVEGDIPADVDAALLTPGAEQDLADAVRDAIADTDEGLLRRDYVAVLGRLARLRPQVDAFFDAVMVNADDAAVRDNRLALLQRLSDRLGSIAAIEHLSS
jgi:glycyl-tRNA synthetase beta chain